MAKLTLKQKIENLKQEVKSAGYTSFESHDKYTDKLVGTMYVVEKMDYGFHIYYIHEPNATKLAGTNGTITEMYYDLRNKVYWIKRNMKEVNFSVRNVDAVFPDNYDEKQQVFDLLSTENNKGLYQSAYNYLGAMGGEVREMYGRFFHRLITEYSYYELLYKAGIELGNLVIVKDKTATSPKDILGLSKTKWKMFSKYGVDISDLQHYNYQDKPKADKKAINYLAYVRSLEEEFGIEKMSAFVASEFPYIYEAPYYRYHHSVLNLASDYNLPEKKVIKYVYFECDVSQGLNYRNAIQEYKDYIRMVNEMGYERYERYPKFLRTLHDVVARNYNVKLNEAQMKEWEEVYEENKSYEFSYDGYKIIAPELPDDLVKEGNVLSHCVSSYVDKVRKRKSIILFLRKKDDIEKPLVTLEVANGRLIQARGKMNNDPTAEQNRILKKFKEKVLENREESVAV